MKALIVGNGIAGISVAKELRQREPDPAKLGICVLAREAYGYYSRIRLPEVFGRLSSGSAPIGPESLALYKPGWYADRHIELRYCQEAVAIDREARRLILAAGAELGYDALVLALGSEPSRPEVPGLALPGVFALREYDDAARVRAWAAAHPGPVAVLGGGLLGLEAAKHLKDGGVAEVAVLEAAPRLLPRQLDGPGAAVLRSLLEAMGLRVMTGAKLASFAGSDRVESLALEGGASLPAATALLSMGVRPRVGIARAAGLAANRGIVVDEFLRSSDPSIYALGDCAEFRGACLGIIPAALEQAPSCAAAILGDPSRPYAGTIASNTLKVAGVDLSSAGLVEAPAGAEELRLEPGPGRYERYLFAEGKLAGAIVLGDKLRARAALALVGKAATRADIEALPKA
jgi:nitrite reductase (NADH) large subunit